MNEKVKKFLEDNKNIELREKENNLIKLGLCEREYRPEGYKDKEKKYRNYDEESGKYYRNIPLDIDDEEYFELMKTTKAKLMLENDEQETGVPVIYSIISVIILICGVIIGFVYLFDSVVVSLLIWMFVLQMYSMGKIVEYLHGISKK